ncbi:MAG: SCO family protein [Planctomycetota bacterium]
MRASSALRRMTLLVAALAATMNLAVAALAATMNLAVAALAATVNLAVAALAATVTLSLSGHLCAQGLPAAPLAVGGVQDRITSAPIAGAALPLDAEFADHTGAAVTLKKYFTGDKPLLLAFVFFECTSLCSPLLKGLGDPIGDLPWTPGKEFDVVVISFDPLDTPAKAAALRSDALVNCRRADATGYQFLTGTEASISKVTSALGFAFEWIVSRREYDHPALVYVMTPDGRLSRYHEGLQFESETLRNSLIEAGQGKIGSFWERLSWSCMTFDAVTGRWVPAARVVMQIGGGLTVLALGAMIWFVRRARATEIQLEAKTLAGTRDFAGDSSRRNTAVSTVVSSVAGRDTERESMRTPQ